MTPLPSLGWTLLLTSWLAGGCTPQGEAGTPQKARKQAERGDSAVPAAKPAPAVVPVKASPQNAAAPEELPRGWPWVLEDDEFEGEGWTFWPLVGPKR